jgi:hypothetical protein
MAPTSVRERWYADCDGLAVDGCEVDSTSDPANCGGCGLACAPGETCASGMCF